MKIRGVILIAMVAFVVMVASAQGAIIKTTSGYPYQTVADESKTPTVPEQVTIIEGDVNEVNWPCVTHYEAGEYRPDGCVYPWAAEMFMDTNHMFGGFIRSALYHELGHIFDYDYLTEGDREWFRYLIGGMPGPWFSSQTHETVGEMFAEAYSQCALFGNRIRSYHMIIPSTERIISRKVHYRICTLIERSFVRNEGEGQGRFAIG